MLQDFLQGLRELVFPDNCYLCRTYLNSSHQQQLCGPCNARIILNTPPFCLNCSRRLETFTHQGLCASCLKRPPVFDSAWSACIYEDALPKLIHDFKYQGKTHLKRLFHPLIRQHIERFRIPMDTFDIIAPVPLHPTRLRERGYNQAALLSAMLAEDYGIVHQEKLLSRTRFTQPQSLSDTKQRWTNTEGAFKINPSFSIADKNILIVDDLMTTAATANEISKVLKEAGAAYIGVLTLAVTAHENPA